MLKQIVFSITLLITLGIFTYSAIRYIGFFRFTRKGFPVRDPGRRLGIMMKVAFGQTKIFRFPFVGLLHAMVFWGFCVILIGSIEMVIDGVSGSEKSLAFLGFFYKIIIGSGDVFGLLIAIAILIFLGRRLFLHLKRFSGIEMKRVSHIDANIALSLILLLMITLLGMNTFYVLSVKLYTPYGGELPAGITHCPADAVLGFYPVSDFFSGILIKSMYPREALILHEAFWWSHILLIFLFANILPYSKHFHVFMSVPNVFLSRLEPLGKLTTMESVTREVRIMLDPAASDAATITESSVQRFGARDAEDVCWKNYLDSLACTECGRCTSVCPANITGKRLSPRKIMMDLRARMKEKGPVMIRKGKDFSDGKSLIRDYISEEELWACTTCNACSMECPVNINHPGLILDMRRYLVMEEGSAPGLLKAMFTNIENNGAPWQFSAEDRMLWANDIELGTKRETVVLN